MVEKQIVVENGSSSYKDDLQVHTKIPDLLIEDSGVIN